MNRVVRLPENEYQHIGRELFKDAENILNHNYEKVYGPTAGTYNFHIVGSHLDEIREHGTLTTYSAYPFEGMYAEMRQCFTPGTRKLTILVNLNFI